MKEGVVLPASEAGKAKKLEKDTYDNKTKTAEEHERKGNRANSNESGKIDDANLLANDILVKAKEIEPNTTDFMKSLETNGCHLEGLKYCLKSRESLARKILEDSRIKGVSLEDAASSISDSLRYTLVSDEANYTQMVSNSLEQLQKKGYVIDKLKNYWGNDIYQGINVSMISPEGIKIELQFHTDASYYTKENLNHHYYEIARSENATQEEIIEATQKMIENQSLVNPPEGSQNISIQKEILDGKD